MELQTSFYDEHVWKRKGRKSEGKEKKKTQVRDNIDLKGISQAQILGFYDWPQT